MLHCWFGDLMVGTPFSVPLLWDGEYSIIETLAIGLGSLPSPERSGQPPRSLVPIWYYEQITKTNKHTSTNTYTHLSIYLSIYLYLSLYIYIYILNMITQYMYVCVCIYIYIYIHTYIHTHTYNIVIACTYVCTHRFGIRAARSWGFLFLAPPDAPHTYVYIYIYICMYICMYIYIYNVFLF